MQQQNIERALQLAQESAHIWKQIGSRHFQRAQRLIAELQDVSTPDPEQSDPAQLAFEAFQRAASPQDIQLAVMKYPIMINQQFIQAVEEIISEQVPSDLKPAFQQRLATLRQIANQK